MKRFHYLGYIIEQGLFGWYVLDWDYEHEQPIGPVHKSKHAAMTWCEGRAS